MQLLSTDRLVREGLATHEILRKLGFRAEDIFFCVNNGLAMIGSGDTIPVRQVGVLLKAQEKQFMIHLGCGTDSSDDIVKAWQEGVYWYNSPATTDVERSATVDVSSVRQQVVELIVSLVNHGFDTKRNFS